ncbi:fimbrial biogenesis chaperone [Yersinia enterocolitica]|uniref:fimbrial biogenesis chaperone n=1 Tax=Yersinia enterocolitica TaxID=630 RepID=UPI0020C9CEE8|nr:molecular chaperone [Yersinia enterocolitica]
MPAFCLTLFIAEATMLSVRPLLPLTVSSCLLLLLATQNVFATTKKPATNGGGIKLSQTRVVFLATDKAQTLSVDNSDSQTYLIQSRIQRDLDDTASAPFIITPPLFPLPANNRQLLRILPQDIAALPTDRESLFYLSVLGIPAQTNQENASSQISMGLRFMIKLFYRPAGLSITPEAAACHLQFSRTPQGVQVNNPTPYYHSLAKLTFNHTAIDLNTAPSMVAPMSRVTYAIPGPLTQVQWQIITDHGGLSEPCQQSISSTKRSL